MDYYLLMERWAEHVRDFKDSERQQGVEAYDAARLAQAVLSFVKTARIRQWNLFIQKRGADFERMMEMLLKEFDPESVERFLESEELWKITLEMGEQ
jgi:hypothetical protein